MIINGLCFAFLAICLSLQQTFAADLQSKSPSPESPSLLSWVIESGDNGTMPFVIVDKKNAKVSVYGADGQLRGVTSALLGLSRSDDMVPGIGNRRLSTIRPDERVTPSGRFVAALGHIVNGQEVLWVDYDSGLALHRVITSDAKERRAQRLASSSALDKRITYGCINVPIKFYESVVSPAFRGTDGIVYVLPETQSGEKDFFARYAK